MSKNVSLITVNYNSGSFLKACALSAMQQVDEFIVVDNASTDDSLAQLEGAFPSESTLKLIRNRDNVGFAAACNIGLSHAAGNYFFFLNPDCVLEPDSVRRLLQVMEDNPDAGMVGGLLINPDGTEQGGGRRAIPTPWRSLVRAFGLYRLADRWPRLFFDFHLHKQPLPEHPLEVEAVSGACMLVRRATMNDVGQWDEGYFLHCEDLDFCMAVRNKGWKILFAPQVRIMHEKGACSHARPIFVEWHKHRGMMRFYRKFFKNQYPGILMWLVMGGIGLRFAAVATYYFSRHCLKLMGLLNE